VFSRRCLALLWLLPTVAAAAEGAPGAQDKPRLAVSPLTAQGATPEEAAALTDAVVQTLASRGLFQVLSQQDVQTIVGAERQRQLLGQCSEDASRCAQDLNAATGARFVLTGALAKIGSTYQLSLQTLDTLKGQSVGRGTRLARDLATLRLLVPYVAAEATGSPLPPPASRVLQYGLLAGGGGVFVAGGVLGMLALGAQSTLNSELCPSGPPPTQSGACTGTALRSLSFYKGQDQSIGNQKTLSLVMMAAGAAAAGAGLFLMPPPESGPRVALVPSPTGIALAGSF
jgi:hypothetical protein